MVATAKSFAIATAIDFAVGFVCFLVFSFLRTRPFCKRFYAPKRYLVSGEQLVRPRRIGRNPFAWLGPTWSYSEEEVLQVAGWDAVVYLRIMKWGMVVFAFLTVWTWIVVLPTNIAGGKYVSALTNDKPPASQYTYWVPPPSPPLAPGADAPPPSPEAKVPEFYTKVPPAPEGLLWYRYNPGIRALPPAPPGYQWRYNSDYQSNSFEFTNLDKASLSNIKPKSPLLVVHVISAWVLTLFVLWMLWRYAKKSVALRIRYLITLPKGSDSNTVLVQDIPGVGFGTQAARAKSIAPAFIANKIEAGIEASAAAALKAADAATKRTGAVIPGGSQKVNPVFDHSEKGSASASTNDTFNTWRSAKAELDQKSMAQLVEKEYSDLFPGEVVAVQSVHDTTELEPLDKEYDKLTQKLWDLIGDYSNKLRNGKPPKKRKQVRVVGATMGEWGREKYGLKPVKKDCLEYWPERLERLREEILAKSEEARNKNVPCAFVTFRSRRAQVVASTTLINHDLSAWLTSPAPAPATVYWGNLRWRVWERSARSALIWAAFWALCFFYLIPIAAVQALVNVNLLKKIPPFKQLLNIQFTNAIIVSILPGLVLKIFLALLPMLLTFMNKRAGMQSLAEIDYSVFVKFFIFQVITVFFGTFVVGSFFSQFNQWLDDPSAAVNLIGTAVPQTASFFLTYMALSALWTVPFSGLNIIGFVIYWLKSKIAATEKARARLWQDQTAKYGASVADHTIAILLGLVYCIIQPVMAPMVLFYFCTSYSIAKYQAIYIKRPAYESGGKIWPKVHNVIWWCLILAQLVLVFILAIKKVIWAPIIVALTIPLSLVTHLAILKRFSAPQQILSYRGATDADNMDELKKETEGRTTEDDISTSQYLNPVFSFSEEEHRELLKQAENVDLILKKERDTEALLPELPDQMDEDELDAGAGSKSFSLPLFKGKNGDKKTKKGQQTGEDETLREVYGNTGGDSAAEDGASPPHPRAVQPASTLEQGAAISGAVAANKRAATR